jgi:hypothetical protein
MTENNTQAAECLSRLTAELDTKREIFTCEHCEKTLTDDAEIVFWKKSGLCSDVCNVFFHVRQNQEAHVVMFNNLSDYEIGLFKASKDPVYG